MSLTRPAPLLVWVALSLLPLLASAQGSAAPRSVLVLYWYNKDYPWNVRFDQSFQATLQSASAGTVEYYSEYLESNRFPGENQSKLLHDYLRQKYADRTIDAVVATSDASLDFLAKHRSDLFPHTAIVFVAASKPTPENLAAGPGMTGMININTHKETLDLALKLHPATERVFIISGTLERDQRFERLAQEELQHYQSRIQITYLTDLEPNELIARTKSLPERSIVLYVWQQAQNERGQVLESADVLALIAKSTPVPIYGMSVPSIGKGSVGGYINTAEVIGTRAAEIALSIANGARAQDIPVENAPTVPMFDWRQLQRWGISEDQLPPGSIVRFKEVTFWQQYKWRIIGIVTLCAVEAILIVALLIQRTRRAKAEESRHLSEEKFSKAFRSSPDAIVITRQSDGAIVEVNDRWEALVGYGRAEARGRTTIDLNLYVRSEEREEFFRQVAKHGFVRDFETNIRTKAGQLRTVVVSSESIVINKEPCFLVIIRDVTDLKNSERALRNMWSRGNTTPALN